MRIAASGGALCLALAAVLVVTAARGVAQPRGGVWRTLACPPARIHHTATLLADGRVLVAGGVGGARSSTALADAHLFDPATDRWTAAPPMPEARYHHTATRLADGRVVVAGGQGASRTLDSVVAFDPARDSWTRLAPLGSARRGHSASLAFGTLYVAGGLAADGSAGMRDVERFDPARGAFAAAPPLRQPRYLHSATELPDGRLVLADSTGVEVYPAGPSSPSTRGWHPLAAAVALSNDRVLFLGGMGGRHDGVTDSLLWEPGRWRRRARMPAGHHGHTATLLRDGKVLVVGGDAADLYDPSADRWSRVATIGQGHILHSATLLADGSVLVAFGHSGTCGRYRP